MSKFILKINGIEYNRFKKIIFKKSIDSICGMFNVVLSDAYGANLTDWNIKIGDNVIVQIEDKIIMIGYIDSIPIFYTPDSHAIQFIGRDKTADLIDCCFDSEINEWSNQTVLNLVGNLCVPFNIEIQYDNNLREQLNTRVDNFKADEGETISEIISKLCRDYSILPLTFNDGRLTLTRALSNSSHDTIELGNNAVSASKTNSNMDRFSVYNVKGYGYGTDNKQLRDYVEPSGYANDTVITRTRPYTIFSDGLTDSGKCINRAKWEKNIRAGKSRAVTYSITGWQQTNGDVWQINSLTRVIDEYLGIDDDMLISEITFYFTENDGEMTDITVVNKNTYSLNEAPIKTKGFDK